MNDSLSLALAVAAGTLLGTFFFAGLWWTVRKGAASGRPALLFFSSLLLRTCIVVVGFYFVLGDDWRRLLAGLLGFIVARFTVMRVTQAMERSGGSPQEASRAS
ncbi:MAG: ATP synthase subunit I [Pseudomonadota bacterium]